MNKYEQAKIYTIKSPSFEKFYIGSTTQPLNIRFSEHKSHYKRYLAGLRNFTSSYEVIKLNDAYIELLEDFKCTNKQELRQQEGKHIQQLKDKLVNIVIPGRRQQQLNTIN